MYICIFRYTCTDLHVRYMWIYVYLYLYNVFFMNTLILKINNKLICFNKISNEFSKTLYYLCREDHVLKGKILLIFKKTKSEIYLKFTHCKRHIKSLILHFLIQIQVKYYPPCCHYIIYETNDTH